LINSGISKGGKKKYKNEVMLTFYNDVETRNALSLLSEEIKGCFTPVYVF